MTRLSTKILVFNIFLSGAANMLVESGAANALGISPQPGAGRKLDEAITAASSINPSGGFGETLFTLYTTMATTLHAIFQGVAAGPIMIANLGMPSWMVAFLFGPQAIIIGLDLYYALTGRDV